MGEGSPTGESRRGPATSPARRPRRRSGEGPRRLPRSWLSASWRRHLPAAALLLLGIVLYGRGMLLGFVGDDFTLLDAALREPLGELLSGRHGIVGYYRPVSRELYFWWWGRVLGLGPGGFHLVNALTFVAIAVMLARLGRRWAGPRAGWLAAAAFVLFPPGSALLAWVSCAQDLIAVFWAVAALLLYQGGRHTLAGLAVLLAALSKETAVVLPAAIVVLEMQLHRRARLRERYARLAPALAGIAVAIAFAVGARATWPAGTAVAVWSPRQFADAWRLPLDFARSLLPPDAGEGIVRALDVQPAWLVIAAALAALAVPPARAWAAPPRGPREARGSAPHDRTTVGRSPETGAARGSAQGPPGAAAPAPPPGPAPIGDRPALLFGFALAVLAMLPVGFVTERWRGYFFSLSAVGGSLAAGVLLARGPVALARGALALGAIVNFGAGGIYRPVEASRGPARHPHVNYAFFRETGAFSTRLLAALEPWCATLRLVPRTFVAGLPPEPAFQSVLGPGLRVTCRDTVARVGFLADFAPEDARADFGLLRFDPEVARFVHERADARVRARIGEGFLVYARYDVAAACFAAAAGGGPGDRELSYPLAISLAAAGRPDEARARWDEARRGAAVLDPGTMAARLLGSTAPAGAAPVGDPPLVALAAAALEAPWEADPHRALGRALLARGRAREATLELSAAAGITRANTDLAWLGQGYEAMGAPDEALAAYQRALQVGLPPGLYEETRTRFMALARRTGGVLDRSRDGP